MTTTKTLRTLTINTGKRVWNLRVISKHGKTWTCESIRKDGKPGKRYTVNMFTKTMSATRITREGGERLYNWDITKVFGKDLWDWRRPAA